MNNYNLNALKILLCDDNLMMVDILNIYLQSFGVTNLCITTPEQCFACFNSEKPDLVIIDWVMPKITGIELTSLIRNSPESTNKFVPIIMVTAQTNRKNIRLARDSGITEIICKPISRNILYKKIISIIEEQRNFIKTDGFFGPDRRRFEIPNWTLDEKRSNVKTSNTVKGACK